MTVTGATTAELASASYSPPYKYVTSYGQAPLVTGTVTSAISVNPTVAPGTSDSQYVTQYLQVHMMSWPSYRYAYLFWMVLALIAIIYALAHHLRLSGGSLGAGYTKWGMRRKPVGRKRGPGGTRGRALPSNSVIVTTLLISVITIVLCLVGADYISPSSSIFNFSTSFRKRATSSPSYTINKAFWTMGSRFGYMAFALMPLVVLLALKAPPFALLAIRGFTYLFSDKLAILHRASAWLIWAVTTVHVALWTVQLFEDSRNGKPVWFVIWLSYRFIFGCIAYGAMTAVMVFSLRPFRKNKYEFFYIAHVVLVILTIVCSAIHHPVLWWWMAAALAIWAGERSFRFIRMARINGFFSGRGTNATRSVSLVAGRPYSNIPQSDKEQYDMSDLKKAAQAFGADAPYNIDKTLPRPPGAGTPGGGTPGAWTPAYTPYASNMNLAGEFGAGNNAGYYDEGSLQPLGSYESRLNDKARNDRYPGDSSGTHFDPYTQRYDDVYDPNQPYSRSDPFDAPSSTTFPLNPDPAFFSVDGNTSTPTHQRGKSSVATMMSSGSGPAQARFNPQGPPPIPVGYAHAQLLPSRTVRLTIRVARPFKWSPGQSVLLYLPELSRIQSHPFTIVNHHGNEIVLLVKARKGLTRKLFEYVRARNLASLGINDVKKKRLSLASMRCGEGAVTVPPVFLPAWVDGPMGSAGRVRWGEYSTVVIVCGGSGVSFGAAVCDYVCSRMARQRERPGRKWHTRRVRFCWVAREYAEIAWVAHQLRRCQSAITAAQLQIDIFVTNASKVRDDFAPPRPGFAKSGSRRESVDSVASDMSQDEQGSSDIDELELNMQLSSSYADVIDLTNYEDEEDVNDPVENQLSDKLQHQGKVRRARSRKAARNKTKGSATPNKSSGGVPERGQQQAMSKSPSSHAPGRSQLSVFDDSDPESAYAGTARGSYHDTTPAVHSPLRSAEHSLYSPAAPTNPPSSHPLITPNQDRRHSYRSFADSTYGAYDPFTSGGGGGAGAYGGSGGPRGPSPSPSIFFDDTHSIAGESTGGFFNRNSRTQSMVLLEDAGQDPTGDAALWVDHADYENMAVLAEMARPGKPKLAQVLGEEIDQAGGSLIVATCGPVTLNTVVRNLVSRHISPGRIRRGDRRGHIAIYSEDYEA